MRSSGSSAVVNVSADWTELRGQRSSRVLSTHRGRFSPTSVCIQMFSVGSLHLIGAETLATEEPLLPGGRSLVLYFLSGLSALLLLPLFSLLYFFLLSLYRRRKLEIELHSKGSEAEDQMCCDASGHHGNLSDGPANSSVCAVGSNVKKHLHHHHLLPPTPL